MFHDREDDSGGIFIAAVDAVGLFYHFLLCFVSRFTGAGIQIGHCKERKQLKPMMIYFVAKKKIDTKMKP